jgi:hypothetical protein
MSYACVQVHGYVGLLDYVWYQPSRMLVKRQIPLPSREDVAAFLPSECFPSDHLSVCTDCVNPCGGDWWAAYAHFVYIRAHKCSAMRLWTVVLCCVTRWLLTCPGGQMPAQQTAALQTALLQRPRRPAHPTRHHSPWQLSWRMCLPLSRRCSGRV